MVLMEKLRFMELPHCIHCFRMPDLEPANICGEPAKDMRKVCRLLCIFYEVSYTNSCELIIIMQLFKSNSRMAVRTTYA